MVKKKKRQAVFALWLMFLLMVAGITFVSFQNGEATKALGDQMITQFAKIRHSQEMVTQDQIDRVTYDIRQSGRALAFLLIGIMGTVTIHVTCSKCSWLIRTGITVVVLANIAYFTEKLKVYIPSRHYSYEEMMISMKAAAVGFVTVSVVTLLGKILKGVSHAKAADSYL